MKKFVFLFLVSVMICSLFFAVPVNAADEISVKVNGIGYHFDVMPVIVDGRTLVPMRGIFEALGAQVNWDDATKTATGTKGDKEVKLTISDTKAYVNGEEKTLDVPATIIEGRTMVPVRFISESLGEKVDWDGVTKTVIVGEGGKNGIADLRSTVHRPVPTEFEKTSSMDDLLTYYVHKDNDVANAVTLDDATKLFASPDEFMSKIEMATGDIAEYGLSPQDGNEFANALRVDVKEATTSNTKVIGRFRSALKDFAKEGDVCLIKFFLKLAAQPEGGDGYATIQIQVEHPKTYKKAVFQKVEAGKEWETMYVPFVMMDGTIDIGIRFAFDIQTVEIADFQVYNFGPDVKIEDLPSSETGYHQLKLDSPWRKEAINRIEEIRKGDFKVVVKDKAGNVVPGANVEFNMFDHEFPFGTAIDENRFEKLEKYRYEFSRNFNGATLESYTKMGIHELRPELARKIIDGALALGAKNFRGHSIVWEKFVSNKGNNLMSKDSKKYFEEDNKEMFEKTIKDYMQLVTDEYPEMKEWDVANELIANHIMRDKYGADYVKEYFSWMREINPETTIFYNETSYWTTAFYDLLDSFKANGTDQYIDALGLQSHFTSYKEPTELLALYDRLVNEYGYKILRVTESSVPFPKQDWNLQAEYLRDMMIASFSHPNIKGITFWDFWETSAYTKNNFMFDADWNMR
ncbi:MAG: hypothetical protein E7396_07360, partial [Ruminococcaceae bacterium]|nr:hypothetical protein [Oscillospiraceae bacterium]